MAPGAGGKMMKSEAGGWHTLTRVDDCYPPVSSNRAGKSSIRWFSQLSTSIERGVSNGRSFLDQAWQIYVSQGIRVDVTGKLVTCWCDVTFDHIRSALRCCQTHRSVWLRDRGHHKPFDNRIQHSALVTLHPGLWHSLKYYFIETPSQASQCS